MTRTTGNVLCWTAVTTWQIRNRLSMSVYFFVIEKKKKKIYEGEQTGTGEKE